MIKTVLDVNILVSAALNRDGLPARVADLAFDGVYEIVISRHIVKKVSEVFQRPYLRTHASSPARECLLRALTEDLEYSSIRGSAPDLEDDFVLGTAVAVNAEYLATGDNDRWRSVRSVASAL